MLVSQVEHISGSAWLRQRIQSLLDEYRVFWALDPDDVPTAWYECEEHDQPHRLDGGEAPWGCSVLKSRMDRQEAHG